MVIEKYLGKEMRKNLEIENEFCYLCTPKQTVVVAQLVRASDCGSEGRGFETLQSPSFKKGNLAKGCLFCFIPICP
jgi:hypothetical protein